MRKRADLPIVEGDIVLGFLVSRAMLGPPRMAGFFRFTRRSFIGR
jgi:hypothetical protein